MSVALESDTTLRQVLTTSFIALTICLASFSLSLIPWGHSFLAILATPVIFLDHQLFSFGQTISTSTNWLTTNRNTASKLAELKTLTQQHAVDQIKLQTLSSEVASLSSLLRVPMSGRNPTAIGRLYSTPYGLSWWFDLGKPPQVGNYLTDTRGVLIGRLVQISPAFATVLPLTDTSIKIAIKTNQGAKGILSGTGEQVIVNNVLPTEPLAVGDIVVTTGTDGLWPPNLVVGTINHVTGNPQALTKGGVVTLLADTTSWAAVWSPL